MKKYLLIVAGGSGRRMDSSVPKQFLTLQNKPLFVHSILAFVAAFEDMDIVLVVPKATMELANRLCTEHCKGIPITLVEGGSERFYSVKNGLKHVTHPSIVFVHDAVRCLIKPSLIRQCYATAFAQHTAIPALPLTDSVRMVTEAGTVAIDRKNLFLLQTPQTFDSVLLTKAYDRFDSPLPVFTDDASVVEANHHAITLLMGDTENIKITHPVDLVVARYILEKKQGRVV